IGYGEDDAIGRLDSGFGRNGAARGERVGIVETLRGKFQVARDADRLRNSGLEILRHARFGLVLPGSAQGKYDAGHAILQLRARGRGEGEFERAAFSRRDRSESAVGSRLVPEHRVVARAEKAVLRAHGRAVYLGAGETRDDHSVLDGDREIILVVN